nr:MAG TPA: hypothetical protein [Caudoviricetes sp.]
MYESIPKKLGSCCRKLQHFSPQVGKTLNQ